MNFDKLLIQDNPPTNRDWHALTQGVMNWTLYALVERLAVTVQCIQRQPYTAVQLVFDAGDKVGEDTILGEGFSKVCHPDTYCPTEGLRIAHMRAIRMIVKALQGTGSCYYVLVAKWDHYLLAVEDAQPILVIEEHDDETVVVGVDPAAEGGGESIGTILVRTMP